MNAAPISSQIDKVTVYRQGARVTRVATVTGGGPPPAVVRISGLPLAMDDGSIQARVSSGDGSAELPVAADLHVVLEVPAVDADLPDADDEELDDARREESRLEQVIAAIEVELGRIDRLQIAPRPKPAEGEAPGESPTSARLALVEFRAAREADLSAELRRMQADLDRARRRRERAEDRDQRASTARQAREHELKKSVEITLRAGRDCASAFAIELDYLVPGARWAPAYTVRLDKEMSAAELAMRAVVGQCTGEDWKGVEVTLSTADAQRWNELPELHSRRIGRRQPKPARVGWRPPPTGADELYADYDRSFAELSIGANMPLPPPPQPSAPADYDALVDGFAPAEAREETVMLALDECEAEAGDYAPPAPMMMSPEAAPTMMARAGALGGLLSRSARPAKKEKAKGRKAAAHADNRYQMQSFAAPAPGGYGAGMVEPELDDDADVGASDAQLAYGGLRMPAPHAAERGHLVIATQQEIYLELFVRQQIVVGFDVVAAIDRAGQRARAIESATLPARHQPAWSEDYDYAYVAEDRLDVPSDGEFHSIPMTSSSAAAKPLYVVVPRASTDVFRTVDLTNPFAAPLLAGPVDVYLGGDFLLTSDVDFTVPRAAVSLGLGVEQAIKVARNTRFREETAGLIGGSLELDHQILIEALNHTERAIELEVRERVPVTRKDEDDIKLEVAKVTPPWRTFDPFPAAAAANKLRGGHCWRLTIEAGGRADMRVDYQIRIAAKNELVGGNRREV